MKKRYKRKIAILMIAVLLVVVFVNRKQLVRAIFNSETAVTIQADSIENGTLIIGTHLINLQALNDEIYQIAVDSISQSGQSQTYYKSELAEGSWFDITSASGLSSITEEGTKVDKSVIEGLAITHHTKSDGITYDLRTNQAVCIFDIYPAYELEQMQELESLKLNYDLLKESGGESDTDKRNLKLLKDFFAMDTHVQTTNEYDAMINALQLYYQQLSQNNAPSEQTDVVLKIMGKLDAGRKAYVAGMVATGLDTLMEDLSDSNGENDDEEYELNDTLLNACSDSQNSISQSQIENEGNMLSQGTTEMTKMEYNLAMDMITKALQSNYAECDADVTQLIHLYHVMDSMIVSATEEVSILDELIAGAVQKYKENLATGVSAEYQAEKEKQSSHALLENLLVTSAEEVNIVRNELQFYISSKAERMETEQAKTFILQCIEDTSGLYAVVKNDELKEKLDLGINEYKTWLQDLLSNLGSGVSGDSQLEQLYEEKASLQEQRLSELDANNLDEAKKLEAKIVNINAKITAEEKKLIDKLTELEEKKMSLEEQINASKEGSALSGQLANVESQIADITNKLSSQSEAKNIMNMKAEAMKHIESGDVSSTALNAIASQIEGLAAFVEADSYLALTAQKALYQKLVSTAYLQEIDSYNGLIERIEEVVAENDMLARGKGMSDTEAVEYLDELLEMGVSLKDFANVQTKETDDGETDDGETDDGEIDESTKEIESGTTQENISSEEQSNMSAAVLALGQYAQDTDNEELKKLAAGIAQKLNNQYPGQVFKTHQSSYGSFVPADTLSKYLEYRYIWNDTKKNAILVNGRNYYSFTAFDWNVSRSKKKVDKLTVATEFDGVVYIPVDYVEKEFEIQIKVIPGTEYSVLVNNKEIEKMQELLTDLSEKGGS